MAIRPILKMGELLLLQTAIQVSPDAIASNQIQEIIQDLLDTMKNSNGAGLAAPQIGISLQIVVFGFEKNVRYPNEAPIPQTILINPIITPLSSELESGWEGCLSVPGLRGLVPRFQHIRYQGLDTHGHIVDRMVSGFHARVVQHECDHLFGKLYPMRIEDMTQFGFTEILFPNL
jgi:peptide deformylase